MLSDVSEMWHVRSSPLTFGPQREDSAINFNGHITDRMWPDTARTAKEPIPLSYSSSFFTLAPETIIESNGY
jgi:hypothetical protein